MFKITSLPGMRHAQTRAICACPHALLIVTYIYINTIIKYSILQNINLQIRFSNFNDKNYFIISKKI
jgi:outer membrane receptor for monomeric catechols